MDMKNQMLEKKVTIWRPVFLEEDIHICWHPCAADVWQQINTDLSDNK